MKNKYDLLLYLAISFVVCLLAASFIYDWTGSHKTAPAGLLLYSDSGKPIKPPFPPSGEHLFGTDRMGNDLFEKILNGAKYTILISLGAAVLRIGAGFAAGAIIILAFKRMKPYIETFLSPFLYVPSFFIVYVITAPFSINPLESGADRFAIFQFFIITLAGVPPLATLFSNEIGIVLKKNYIAASYLMGASKFHVLFRHVFPVLKARMAVLMIQQIISVMILLLYLGIFQQFIGGKLAGSDIGDLGKPVFLSKTGEWAGMIGQSVFDLNYAPWIVLTPAIAFVVLIGLLQFIEKRLQRAEAVSY